MTNGTLPQLHLFADGLYFGESPRWRDGKLYISDMTGRKIYVIDSSGRKEVLVEVENQPNGMCFKEDGSLVYSSMFDGKLYEYKNGQSQPYADLSSVMTGYCGDMVIDAQGRVYMDDTGARVLHGEKPCPGRILLIETDRSIKIVADNIVFPNGIGIDSAGKHLYISETFAYQLDKFEIAENGDLRNRRVYWDTHELPTAAGHEWNRFCGIDGLCIDSEDGVWLSMLGHNAFIRKDAQGNITDRIDVDGDATACALGGEDGNTLFLVVNKVPEGMDLFQAMVDKLTKCTIYTMKAAVGRGHARP
ncbi:uncharacterized protein Z518_10782 [Rhinocladiella mackenziei CBS 650.93]|uniref:SMP-30/Gluconolactonase/LRE-like region domain-containing protein n=1 Tax=Rhinocladiella mackenziei CBS 650.93 TaxID=1442369 RepID=A0A0D2ISX9_9EURO|nr:uncharacterized protein Z518_10782 [Rhinocladiella mackenziei CBS 650.93]KIW99854.1 hypothetical protein Z518_10782 [Rhinocladiella mackenziei CBS 650.93]